MTGDPRPGKTLSVDAGTWQPGPVRLAYQWKVDGKNLVKADKGKKITVKVTGKKTGYTTLTKTSKKTGKVK